VERHVDDTHFNPVKHGYVAAVRDWPYSTFHVYVRNGWLSEDWGCKGQEGTFREAVGVPSSPEPTQLTRSGDQRTDA
jgi:hypothetical protein